ncbi:hypothetical protein B0H14DRAFT_3487347 [Mycena olivaceomarginata]|nr:hypothetical protein B0H14DRAFT_3487347 [Mycena olivaceomarginata]
MLLYPALHCGPALFPQPHLCTICAVVPHPIPSPPWYTDSPFPPPLHPVICVFARDHTTALAAVLAHLYYEHFAGDEKDSYKAVFTGPDSAKDETKPVKKKVQNSSTCPPVCEILNMGGKVTRCSIAYAAALAHVSHGYVTDLVQLLWLLLLVDVQLPH